MATLESTAAGSRELPAAAIAGDRPAVEVAHLRKTYGTLVAVRHGPANDTNAASTPRARTRRPGPAG